MLPQKIFSIQHPFVKHWKKLRTDKKYRQEQRSIIIFGKKMILEAAASYTLKRVIISPISSQSLSSLETYIVSEEIFKKISGMKNPELIAAEIDLPRPTSLYEMQYLLALDRISDPGNLGTLIRSASALGIHGILLFPGCVDIFNDKALRAAKGASLFIPFQYIKENDLDTYASTFSIYIGDLEGKDFQKIQYKSPCILLLGNESSGISKSLTDVGEKITIPMKNATNSLNVSTAGTLLIYQMLSSIH